MCPSAQATQRCEWVPLNSSVISGARALAGLWNLCESAQADACCCEPMRDRHRPAEPLSLL